MEEVPPYPLPPPQGPARGGVEVVPLPGELLPAGLGPAAPVGEVALGAVGGPGDPPLLHLGAPVEVEEVAAYLLAPAQGPSRGGVEVVPLPVQLLPAGLGPAALVGEVAAGVVGPGHPPLLHYARPVEVEEVAPYLLAPAQGLARGGVEVVPLAGELLPAGQRPPVPVEVALQAIGIPGDPAPLHDAGAVEVVPVAADLLAPLHRLPVGSVVVGLATNRLPNITIGFDN